MKEFEELITGSEPLETVSGRSWDPELPRYTLVLVVTLWGVWGPGGRWGYHPSGAEEQRHEKHAEFVCSESCGRRVIETVREIGYLGQVWKKYLYLKD